METSTNLPEWSIYKITNLVNNKIYFGETKRQINIRFKSHIHDAMCKSKNRIPKCRLLARAILKYGKDNFSIEKLDFAPSKKEALEKESILIQQFDSTNPKIGYNLKRAGSGVECVSIETRSKTSKSHFKNYWHKKGSLGRGISPEGKYYTTRINFLGKRFSKTFRSIQEAKEAWDKMALYLHGEDIQLHFEDKRNDYLKEDLQIYFNSFILNQKSKQPSNN